MPGVNTFAAMQNSGSSSDDLVKLLMFAVFIVVCVVMYVRIGRDNN